MPPAFTLQRLAVHAAGCFGVLKVHSGLIVDPQGMPFAVTLERTYDSEEQAGQSERYESSDGPQFVKVQRGIHRCVRRFYAKGGYETYEIQQAGHTAILFHKGNTELHSEGCVLVAESFSKIGEAVGILNGAGLDEFLRLTAGLPEFEIEVL